MCFFHPHGWFYLSATNPRPAWPYIYIDSQLASTKTIINPRKSVPCNMKPKAFWCNHQKSCTTTTLRNFTPSTRRIVKPCVSLDKLVTWWKTKSGLLVTWLCLTFILSNVDSVSWCPWVQIEKGMPNYHVDDTKTTNDTNIHGFWWF
jgi:hypothetical protein